MSLHTKTVATLALLALGTSIAQVARATPPAKNGRIVFERLRYQDGPSWGELFVMNPDGTGVRKLTHRRTGPRTRIPTGHRTESESSSLGHRQLAHTRSGP